jgi:hypothetical protein
MKPNLDKELGINNHPEKHHQGKTQTLFCSLTTLTIIRVVQVKEDRTRRVAQMGK